MYLLDYLVSVFFAYSLVGLRVAILIFRLRLHTFNILVAASVGVVIFHHLCVVHTSGLPLASGIYVAEPMVSFTINRTILIIIICVYGKPSVFSCSIHRRLSINCEIIVVSKILLLFVVMVCYCQGSSIASIPIASPGYTFNFRSK